MLFASYTAYNITQNLYSLEKVNKVFLRTFNSTICNKHYTCYRRLHTKLQNNPWKVLFFGTNEFSVESLKILHKKYKSKVLQQLEIVADTKKENPVTKYAKQNNIIIRKWPVEINNLEFDIGIVVSFGHLIPSKIINTFPLGMLNVHASLLPRWRGAAPISYALMNGDQQTGATIMKIAPKRFDVGDIVLQKQIDIDEHETLPVLCTKLAKLGANLLEETFKNLLELLQSAKPQDEINATYAPKITSKSSVVNWNEMSATNVYNLHRALLNLYPLTTSFQNKKIKLLDVQKIESELIARKLNGEEPGVAIYDKDDEVLVIKCKENSFISVKKVTMEGRSTMSAFNFHNGFMAGKKKTKVFFS